MKKIILALIIYVFCSQIVSARTVHNYYGVAMNEDIQEKLIELYSYDYVYYLMQEEYEYFNGNANCLFILNLISILLSFSIIS